MQQRTLTAQRLVALFLLGLLIFNYPLLSLFNDAGTWFGVPRLYAYLFLAWAVFIGLLALIAEPDVARKSAPGKEKD
jgi:hypothetical protein